MTTQSLLNRLNGLLKTGTDPEFPLEANIAIQNANVLIAVGLFTTFVFCINDIFTEQMLLLRLHGLTLLTLLFCVVCIDQRRHSRARILAVLSANLGVFFSWDILGRDSLVHLFFLPLILIPIVTAEKNRTWSHSLAALLAFTGWIFGLMASRSIFIQAIPDSSFSPWLSGLLVPGILIALGIQNRIFGQEFTALDEKQRRTLIAKGRSEALDQMAGELTHQITSPLTLIAGSAALIRTQLVTGNFNREKFWGHLQRIEETTQRIAKIVANLDQYKEKCSSFVTTRTLIDEIISQCQEKFSHGGVEIRREDIQDIEIHVRPPQLSQDILNLLYVSHSAIMHLPERWIGLRGFTQGNEYVIEISDSAQGRYTHHRSVIRLPLNQEKITL